MDFHESQAHTMGFYASGAGRSIINYLQASAVVPTGRTSPINRTEAMNLIYN
ncbi:MAG: hypothetical protein JWR72_3526 [Flavisolibacter sp.]|nr:hypothetical protein [Flavisolibacter sp.]